jgi:selenocysteine-specific elongation factor
MRRPVVIGTAGHIDHGKSALVRALTGTDPDRLKEERERGITVDLGFAHLETSDADLAFVDVPGHERFVKNMLAGAGGIDLVMLVVAADESVMPQTREHFQICRLLEVDAGVVVLTKCDLADAEMREIAAMDVAELVKDSFLAAAPVVEVSARTGEGLDRLRSTLEAEGRKVPARSVDGPVRLPIDRVFTIKGFGTVVTGTLVSGTLREEQELVVLPRAQPVKVRGLQLHGRRDVAAGAGRRTAVNLGGVDVADLARGDTLCEPGAFEPTRRIDVTLDLLEEARPLRHGARIRFHQGTSELLGRVALASRRGAGTPIAEAGPGDSVYARIRLEALAVLTRGDRFIVRAYSPSVTVGGGRVLDPHPPREAIRTEAGRARLTSLNDSIDRAVMSFVAERRGAGLPRAALASRAGLAAADAAAVVDRLVKAGEIVVAGDLLVAAAVAKALADRLISELQAHHKSHPLAEGMPREEARERVFGRAALPVFEHVLERLVAARRITARERLALEGHAVSLSPEESRVQERLLSIYREARLAPPDPAAAAADAAASREIVERVLKLLLRQRSLVKVDTLVFHPEALEGLKNDVRALKAGAPDARVDVASFKEKYGITRKYAIPLLEFLDRERITRRVGDSRVVL